MLEMKNVTKTFGDFKALNNLSLHVPQGAVYGLVGPNGAGKTTVIRHLTGIYQPDSGTVTLDGQPVWNDPAVKERIGYIPDEVFYFPTSTLEDMHRFYRQMYEQFDEERYQKLRDISPLYELPKLERFWCGYTAVPAEQRTAMEAAHPDCEFDWVSMPTEGTWRKHPHYDTIYQIFHEFVYYPFDE